MEVLILLFAYFRFYSVVRPDSKVHNSASSHFLLIIKRSGFLAEIKCLSDSKSPQVSWTLLRILANRNNAVVWTVYTRPVIIIIIIIIYSSEFLTSALVDGFSLDSEWQQVSSSLKDSSQYYVFTKSFNLDKVHWLTLVIYFLTCIWPNVSYFRVTFLFCIVFIARFYNISAKLVML